MRLEGLSTGLFSAGERVCLGVSGGADSVALLLAMMEANAAKESLGVVLRAVHVHHGLRGEEADADEAFVRELLDRKGVPLTVERVDVPARQAQKREGMEEAARELRYAVFRRLMADGKADAVATAHTLDDQAETVLMKLMRGAWTEGLGGISPVIEPGGVERTQVPAARTGGSRTLGEAGRIVRPMLGVRRAEVEAFLRERGQGWREDRTNADVRFARNRVRHELLPVLRRFNPEVDEALARMAEIARDEEAYWEAEVARVLPGLVLPGKPVRGGGRAVSTGVGERAVAVELERLRALPAALRRRVIRGAAEGLGRRLSAEETAKVLGLAGLGAARGMTGRIGARLELAGGLRAERSAREIRLSRVEKAMLPKM